MKINAYRASTIVLAPSSRFLHPNSDISFESRGVDAGTFSSHQDRNCSRSKARHSYNPSKSPQWTFLLQAFLVARICILSTYSDMASIDLVKIVAMMTDYSRMTLRFIPGISSISVDKFTAITSLFCINSQSVLAELCNNKSTYCRI